MSRTDETVAAILRFYRECVAAGFPPDKACARQFATLYDFACHQSDDRKFERAVLAIQVIFRFLKQPQPSRKSVERILAPICNPPGEAAP